jgi:hypothetical protein
MAYNAYGCIALTGGTDGTLDSVAYSTLVDGDMAFVVQAADETIYVYTFDSSDASAESSPDIIKPDDAGANNGRWNLVSITQTNVLVKGTFDIQSTTAVSGILDEDAMGSDSATDLATQQSIKAYVDGRTPSEACGFKVRPAAQQSGAFDGATTTVVWGAEDFDIGSDFAANQFTAPETGYYQFNVHINLLVIDTATVNITVRLNLSGSDNVDFVIDPVNDLAADGGMCVSFGVLTDMTAADTAHVEIIDTGEGAEQMTLETTSTFSGYQVA